MEPIAGLGDRAYADLKRRIVECEILPGASVTQSGLLELVGASRGALRAALTRLTQEGLLHAVPRQGYLVSPLTVKDAEDIMQVRAMLEPEAAFLAAGKVPAPCLKRVRRGFAEAGNRTHPATISRYIATNRYFKASIAEATGNRWLVKEVSGLLDQFERYLRLVHQRFDRQQQLIKGADSLISALERGDQEGARAITQQQMMTTRDDVIRFLMSSDELREQELKMDARPS